MGDDGAMGVQGPRGPSGPPYIYGSCSTSTIQIKFDISQDALNTIAQRNVDLVDKMIDDLITAGKLQEAYRAVGYIVHQQLHDDGHKKTFDMLRVSHRDLFLAHITRPTIYYIPILKGNVEMIKKICSYQPNGLVLTDEILREAIRSGRCKLFVWLLKQSPQHVPNAKTMYYSVIHSGRPDMIDTLVNAIPAVLPDNEICDYALECGCINIFKILLQHNRSYTLGQKVLGLAIRDGRMNVVEYITSAHKHLTRYVWKLASQYNRLEILEWAFYQEYRCNRDDITISQAIKLTVRGIFMNRKCSYDDCRSHRNPLYEGFVQQWVCRSHREVFIQMVGDLVEESPLPTVVSRLIVDMMCAK